MKHEREVRSVEFRPAKGGLVSRTDFQMKKGGPGVAGVYDYTDNTAIHPSMDHAVAHLRKMMGHHFPKEGKEEE